MALKRNVGGWDRAVRVILGLALLAFVITEDLQGLWGITAFLVGSVALITGVMRYCPINRMLGINTCAASPGPAE